jgi:hypothetical protein
MFGWKRLCWAAAVCVLVISSAMLVDRDWYTLTVSRAVQEDDVREAAIRQGLGKQLRGCGGKGWVCCTSIRGVGDPSEAFLARFDGQFIKGSDCSRAPRMRPDGSIDILAGPIETKTGRAAMFIEFGPITWRGRTEARLDVSAICGGLCGVGGTFAARRESDGWTVESLVRWVA